MHSMMIAAHPGDRVWAERVAAKFRAELGDENVLISFGPGDRQGWSFVSAYREDVAARECRALLIVLGPAWINSMKLLRRDEDPMGAVLDEAIDNDATVVLILTEGIELVSGHASVELPETAWQDVLNDFVELFAPYVKGQVHMAMAAPPEELTQMEEYGGSVLEESEPSGAAEMGDIVFAPEPELTPKMPESAPAEEPPSEPVMLGASTPKAVKPGDEFTARFVAYEKQLEQEVRELLKKLSPKVEPVLGVHECRWRLGTRVTVKLAGRGLTIDLDEQEFVWNGGRFLLEFDVAVPADARESTIVLKFDVIIEGIIIARLRLDLEITNGPIRKENATTTVEPAKSAFASYSSKDRLRVLDRVAAVKIAAGLDVFLDCLDLHPGEEWKPRLDAEIRDRDLFLVFWSKNASESEWVAWELNTATKEKGAQAFQLHPLDPDVKPPAGLERFHVGDAVMWVRKGYEASLAGRT